MSDMLGTRRWDEAVRRWAVALALLALLLQGAAPAGFMLARENGQATIVICTGHGAAHSLADLASHPTKAPKSQPDAPCAFAGHGVVAPPPLAALIEPPCNSTSCLQIARPKPSPP